MTGGECGCCKRSGSRFVMGVEDTEDLLHLEKALGHVFSQRALLETAVTHASCGGKDNQRLEFLGDAVLQLVMSERIYAAHPAMPEGEMTFLRARMVREETLSQVAESLELGRYLRMNKSCEQAGGRHRASVLSDAMEAVLAAVYLDGGFQAAAAVVASLWPSEEDAEVCDSKSALQDYLQSRGEPAPVYRTIGEEGPPHMRVFTVAAYAGERELSQGQGASKKRAEQEAARRALSLLTRAEE